MGIEGAEDMNSKDTKDTDNLNPVNDTCVMCKERLIKFSNSLCYKCHPLFKHMYPYRSSSNRGYGLSNEARLLPKCPTDAIPGTKRKIRVLMERARSGEELWHPDDLTLDKLNRLNLVDLLFTIQRENSREVTEDER